MTLRDHFAAACIQGLLACESNKYWTMSEYAKTAYKQADAMMEYHKTTNSPNFDPEELILVCVPGGKTCKPQMVADNIRAWFNAKHTIP